MGQTAEKGGQRLPSSVFRPFYRENWGPGGKGGWGGLGPGDLVRRPEAEAREERPPLADDRVQSVVPERPQASQGEVP